MADCQKLLTSRKGLASPARLLFGETFSVFWRRIWFSFSRFDNFSSILMQNNNTSDNQAYGNTSRCSVVWFFLWFLRALVVLNVYFVNCGIENLAFLQVKQYLCKFSWNCRQVFSTSRNFASVDLASSLDCASSLSRIEFFSANALREPYKSKLLKLLAPLARKL